MSVSAADQVALAQRALASLDLTSLGEDDTPSQVEALCASAAGLGVAPAAVCVYPEHIATARRALDARGLAAVRVATVTNFPDGSADLERAVRETRRAVAAGADEVDVVFPWRAVLAGDASAGARLVAACRIAARDRTLKVILETGELPGADAIRNASVIALEAGADFIKTSTGKVKVNATPEAARVMLAVLRERGGRGGLKVAGGVRTLADAARYLQLADEALGAAWATPQRFRIGASGLLADIRAVLASDGAAPSGSPY